MNQTFRNFEIIIVNDGSSDSTPEICYELSVKYDFIKIINQKNRGLGIARNVGITHAKGEYICFFDVDDRVDKDWLETLYAQLNTNPEILIFGYREININNKSTHEFQFPDLELFSNQEIGEIFPLYLSGLKFNNGFAWNKVYMRDFLVSNNLKFPNIKIQQDEIFNHKVYCRASHIKLIPFVLYDYFIYAKGNNRNNYIPNRILIFDDVKKSFLKLNEWWNLEDEQLDCYIRRRHLLNAIYNHNPYSTYADEKKEILAVFNSDEIKESLGYILSTYHFKRKEYFFKLHCKKIAHGDLKGYVKISKLEKSIQRVLRFFN